MNSTVTGIEQKVGQEQQAQWDALVQEIAKIDIQETKGALRMGDILTQIAQNHGPKYLRVAATQAGVSWSVARQRFWVSTKIPKGSPIRDNTTLSFGHLRVIAGTEDPLKWANLAETQELTVRTLTEAIAQAGEKSQINTGSTGCTACKQPLSETDFIVVALSSQGGKRNLLCSHSCAIQFHKQLLEKAQEPDVDPFLAALTESTTPVEVNQEEEVDDPEEELMYELEIEIPNSE